MSDNKNKGINPVVAGVVGVAIGAAIGAGAEAIREYDKKNPGKLNKKLKDLENRGKRAFEDIKKTANDVKGRVEDMASKAGERVEESKTKTKKKLKS